jgi:hypothetical protein
LDGGPDQERAMVGTPHTPAEKPYDPYAPEVVRKMAVVALVCTAGALGLAALCGILGFHSYAQYTRAVEHGEAIYTHWLDNWLLSNFGPFGVLVFDEVLSFLFVGVAVVSVREWRVMRTGVYDPQRDKAPPGLFLAIGLVGTLGILTFFAVARLSTLLSH